MIKWSFSSLKQYVNCPRQYHEVRVLKNYETKVSKQMLYGTEVHKALEDYVRENTELPKNYKQFKSLVDVLLEIPGDRYVEYKMALSADKLPCEFDSPDYWVRGIVDFMVVDDTEAFIIDYKTGSNKYPDPSQLKLMSLLVFAHFPHVTHVKGGLLFVAHSSFVPDDYSRLKIPIYWAEFAPKLERLQISIESGNWPPNATPLCRWCPVSSCQFNKE